MTNPHDFEAVKKALADAKIDTSLAEITYIPQNTIKLEEKGAEQMLKLMEVLMSTMMCRRCTRISTSQRT